MAWSPIRAAGNPPINTQVQGNIIGLGADGDTLIGQRFNAEGVLIETSGVTVGGTTAADRNIISGNSQGIRIENGTSSNNTIQGNYIGTDPTGILDYGNRSDDGVEIQSGASNNVIGGVGAGRLGKWSYELGRLEGHRGIEELMADLARCSGAEEITALVNEIQTDTDEVDIDFDDVITWEMV